MTIMTMRAAAQSLVVALVVLLLSIAAAPAAGVIVPPAHSPVSASAVIHDDDPLSGDPRRAQTCTPAVIEVPLCTANKFYNNTAQSIPGYSGQSEVARVLEQFKDLVNVPCAPYMRLFVCSMHLPLCASLLVRPCKEFCERIRDLCTPMLLHFGHKWPPSLACEGLVPERDESAGDVGGGGTGSGGGSSSSAGKPPQNLCIRPNSRDFEEELERLRSSDRWRDLKSRKDPVLLPPPPPPLPPRRLLPATSVPPLATPSSAPGRQDRRCSAAEVTLGHDPSGATCAQRCHASFLFSREDKAFASIWLLIWSTVCFVCSALAVVTFAMDSDRFLFPERPIVWVAACYVVFSLGHILRAGLGPEVACSQLDGPGAAPELYRVSRHAGHWCAVIFLLLYFSSLAGCLWWLLLTVCWYLCAARKWAHEALAHRTVWLHVFAWGAPLILSVVLLVLHRIEADELTHLCVVDASSQANVMIFIIAPMSLSLLLGLGFLASALCSSVSVRHSLKWSGNSSFRRLEKLMTKIALFSFLFVMPTACVLAANTYEFLERGKWTASVEKLLARPSCVNATGLLATDSGDCLLEARPSSAFYMLKIFMSLAAGLPAGLVVWFNCKSLSAWHSCLARALSFARLRGRGRPSPSPGHGHPRGPAPQLQDHLIAKSPAAAAAAATGGCSTLGGYSGQLRLLGSGQSKYPPISGIGTTQI